MGASRPLRHWWQSSPRDGDGEHWSAGAQERGRDDEAEAAALRRRVQELEAKLREEAVTRLALEERLAQAQRMQALGQLAAGSRTTSTMCSRPSAAASP